MRVCGQRRSLRSNLTKAVYSVVIFPHLLQLTSLFLVINLHQLNHLQDFLLMLHQLHLCSPTSPRFRSQICRQAIYLEIQLHPSLSLLNKTRAPLLQNTKKKQGTIVKNQLPRRNQLNYSTISWSQNQAICFPTRTNQPLLTFLQIRHSHQTYSPILPQLQVVPSSVIWAPTTSSATHQAVVCFQRPPRRRKKMGQMKRAKREMKMAPSKRKNKSIHQNLQATISIKSRSLSTRKQFQSLSGATKTLSKM